MRTRVYITPLVLVTLSVAARVPAGEWPLHTLDRTTVNLLPVDSVVAIRLSPRVASASGRAEFAQRRPELVDVYVPWNLGDGFWVFGIEPAQAIENVLDQLRSDSLVRMVNPVLRTESSGISWMTDLIAVRFRDDTPVSKIDSVNSILAAYVNPRDPEKPFLYWVRVRSDLGRSALEVADAYYSTGLCLYAQPNFIWRMYFPEVSAGESAPKVPLDVDSVLPPTDPYYGYQWHWRNTGQARGTVDADVDADSAWLITQGDPRVRVAILDASFHTANHEDRDTLTPVFAHDCVGESRVFPQPDDVVGVPCVGSRKDFCGHGTLSFGVLAAGHYNPFGIKGLAPRCTYWLIKCFDDDCLSSDSLHAASLRYSWKTARCQITSNAWYSTFTTSGMVTEELQEMRDSGIASFFCAGNFGTIWYPAVLPTVTAIGATDRNDAVCSFSGKGPALDFVAPGEYIWTWDDMGDDGYVPPVGCENPNYFCSATGTSVATPIAAGIAALVLSVRPDYMDSTDPAGIIHRILVESAEDKGPPGYDTVYGYGRLNAYHALMAACDCPHQGDVTNDGVVDAFDVIQEVDIAFSGGLDIRDPRCPTTRGDVVFDTFVDVFDLVRLVGIVSNGEIADNPCAP